MKTKHTTVAIILPSGDGPGSIKVRFVEDGHAFE